MFVESGTGSFGFHWTSGRLQGYQNADGGFLTVKHTAQIAHVFHAGLAAFDLDDDLFRFGGFRVVAEKNLAVNAVIRTFLLLDRPGADQSERPPLELIFVLLGENRGFVRRGRFANGDDFDFVAVGVAETILDERGGQLRDVYANPFAAKLLGVINCRSAAAEWVENNIAGIAANFDDAFEERDRLLCWIAETFGSLGIYRRNVSP